MLEWVQEMLEANKVQQAGHDDLDMAELQDDPELQSIYSDRLAAMQKEAERRQKQQRAGHGELTDVKVHIWR